MTSLASALLVTPLIGPLTACDAGPAERPAPDTAVTDSVPGADDIAPPDPAEPAPDTAGETDVTSPSDTVAPAPDTAASVDTAAEPRPLPGFGAITGACDFLDSELTDAAPGFVVNHFDFGADPYDHPADLTRFTADGQAMMAAGNAGGSSILSEILAVEYLVRCEGGRLLKTETAIRYDVTETKVTDFLAEIDGLKIGVSVTRAVDWPRDAPYPPETATRVLTGKLEGIAESTANVSDADRWQKQILHVFAYSEDHATVLEAAWQALPAGLRGDTLVLVSVTDGSDAFVYDSFRP